MTTNLFCSDFVTKLSLILVVCMRHLEFRCAGGCSSQRGSLASPSMLRSLHNFTAGGVCIARRLGTGGECDRCNIKGPHRAPGPGPHRPRTNRAICFIKTTSILRGEKKAPALGVEPLLSAQSNPVLIEITNSKLSCIGLNSLAGSNFFLSS